MGIFTRGSKLWITFKDAAGKWRNASTGHAVGEEALAQAKLEAVLAGVKAMQPARPRIETWSVRAYAAEWLPKRQEADLDWKNDASRLNIHVLPVIGDMRLADVLPRHIVDLVHKIRTSSERPVAQRTVYNIYSVVSAFFRDAALQGLIAASPCILTDVQLGPLVDKDPEWRDRAIFTREEVEQIISDPRIPPDRHVVYALEFLAGVRHGEGAGLRWRHYDMTRTPLRQLLVAHSYNTRKGREKATKTNAVRHVPVHPVLAAMLGEWKLEGWEAMMGRAPGPDDLIVPLPPDVAARRRSRSGEAFRGHDYSGKRWREDDLPALGLRHRRGHDARATFITLAIEDGADPEIIETRVTHTRASGRKSAFTGYNRGAKWDEACREVAKLRITRGRESIAKVVGGEMPPYDLLTAAADDENDRGKSGGGGSRRPRFLTTPSTESADPTVVRTSALRVVPDPSVPAHADRSNVRSEVAAIAADLEALHRRLLALVATPDD